MARSITPPVNKDTLQRNNCNPSTKGRTRLHNGPTASLSSLYPTPLSLLGNRQRQPRSRRLSCPVTRLDRNIRLFTARTHSSPPTTTASRASMVRAVSSEIIKILVSFSFFFPVARNRLAQATSAVSRCSPDAVAFPDKLNIREARIDDQRESR